MSSFVDFARAHGVEIDPGKLFASERIRRCPTTEKPKSTNGAYFWDGERGWVFAWDGAARVQWWNDPTAKAWTDEEKRAWAIKRQSANADQQRKHENAALQAAVLVRSTLPSVHDYLVRKGLPKVEGLVLPDGELLVPMRNLFTNELQGAQIIRWIGDEMRWEKKMVPGMRAKGAVLRLGPKTSQISILAEGYATSLSIEMACRQLCIRASVICCFSANNMACVAPQIKGRVGIFADHDESEAGEKTALSTGLPYVMCDEKWFDANDLHVTHGLFALARKVSDLSRLTAIEKVAA